MPKSSVVHLIYARRAGNRRAQREQAEAVRLDAKAERRHARNAASARKVEGRLLDRIRRIERHPSPLAVAQLRGMAADRALPSTARALAAEIVLRWGGEMRPRKTRHARKSPKHPKADPGKSDTGSDGHNSQPDRRFEHEGSDESRRDYNSAVAALRKADRAVSHLARRKKAEFERHGAEIGE